MKKFLAIIVFTVLTTTALVAQVVRKTLPAAKQSVTIKTETVPPAPPPAPAPPPPATTNKTTSTQTENTPVYSLTAARVNITTGSDNKEFPSTVTVYLWKKGTSLGDYPNNCLFSVTNLKNEMAVNSRTDMGLEKYAGTPDKFTLANLQATGFELRVSYSTNFFMDAWKVENISLTLEFRDQNGNLHPTMGSKTISFSNAIGFLNAEYSYFKCITDQNFNSLTASIEKR